MNIRATLRRWHVWLGWLVAIPVLFWTFSGFVMSARPISEVRGEDQVRALAPIRIDRPLVMPALEGMTVGQLRLEPRAEGPRWVVRSADGETVRRADALSGQWLPPMGAAAAVREVRAQYVGKSKIVAVHRQTKAMKTHEIRDPIDGWRVDLEDQTHFFVDAGSGAIVAHRSAFWRFYDFLWGLHIMDLSGRTDPHNPWIVMFSLFSLVMVAFGLVLLPAATRRQAKFSPPPSPPQAAPTRKGRKPKS